MTIVFNHFGNFFFQSPGADKFIHLVLILQTAEFRSKARGFVPLIGAIERQVSRLRWVLRGGGF